MRELLNVLRWQDLLDIFAVSFLIYRVLVFIRRTRALQMLTGLALLIAAFFFSQHLELFTLKWILNSFLGSLILVIFILFQAEIRRGLTQVGTGTFFWDAKGRLQLVEELSRAALFLASKKIGGLIVIERSTGLKDYVQSGTPLDAVVNRELLISIFNPASPLHDGAVIIQQGRIAAAGVFLPFTANPKVSRYYGARHRAAMGITEESDALAVLISEEEGHVSVVLNGEVSPRMDRTVLQGTLREQLSGSRKLKPKQEKKAVSS